MNQTKEQIAAGYNNPKGTWNVTTEGDVEGRSTRNLGTHTGYVDEIALYLADQCYYSLQFTRVEPVLEYKPTKDKVNVTFDIGSGTWDLKGDERVRKMKEVFRDRPVFISDGSSFASFTISTSQFDATAQLAHQAAGKLTPEELAALLKVGAK